MKKQEILTRLIELKPTITEQYKVREISLFGSYVRGEQVEDSDIDLLVEFDETADLFDLIGLELYLEDVFNRKVDVVPKQSLRPEISQDVLDQIITICEIS